MMFLLSSILTLIAPPQMISDSLSYYLIEFVLVVAFALALLALAGLHALQRGRYGQLGAVGFLLMFLGYAIVFVIRSWYKTASRELQDLRPQKRWAVGRTGQHLGKEEAVRPWPHERVGKAYGGRGRGGSSVA
jgi:hypothetical protein